MDKATIFLWEDDSVNIHFFTSLNEPVAMVSFPNKEEAQKFSEMIQQALVNLKEPCDEQDLQPLEVKVHLTATEKL